MPNIYYDPEKFGLSIVGEVEFSNDSYEFDTTVVWRDKNGTLYCASDSGCSCPSPFEDLGIADLTKIERIQDLIDYFENRKNESYYYYDEDSYYYDEDSYFYEEDCRNKIDAAIGRVIMKASA